MKDIRRMEYRQAKQSAPYCDKCDMRLLGNGSTMMPYRCNCGTWKYIRQDENKDNQGKYKIV